MILVLCLGMSSLSFAAETIGVLTVVIGTVSVEREGSSIAAELNSKLYEDDVIATGVGVARRYIYFIKLRFISVRMLS